MAVKHLTPTANPESQEQLEDFAREATLLRALEHRHATDRRALLALSDCLYGFSMKHMRIQEYS